MHRDLDRLICHGCTAAIVRSPDTRADEDSTLATSVDDKFFSFDRSKTTSYSVVLKAGYPIRLHQPGFDTPFMVAFVLHEAGGRWIAQGGDRHPVRGWDPLDDGLKSYREISPDQVIRIFHEAKIELTPQLKAKAIENGNSPIMAKGKPFIESGQPAELPDDLRSLLEGKPVPEQVGGPEDAIDSNHQDTKVAANLSAVEADIDPGAVKCSQADVARFMGVCENTARLLEKLKDQNIIVFRILSPNKKLVLFLNSSEHEKFRASVVQPTRSKRRKKF